MNYTILSARYANAEETAIVLHTEEAGAVAICAADAPDLWEKAVSGDVAPYAPPEMSYSQKRAAEYPPVGDQLDALWKGGADAAAMKAQIDAVKVKYPKPNGGGK